MKPMKAFLIFCFVITFPAALFGVFMAPMIGAILLVAAMVQATGAALCDRLDNLIAQGKPKMEAAPKEDAREVNYSGSFSGGGPE